MSLSLYNKKRNFESTNEPKGKLSKQKLNRFVIQFHQARKDHYDFRLEYNGVLLSWAVPKGLSKNPKDKRLAIHVEDHPVDYIDFEGIIPKGNYGAGTVEVYDSGYYQEIEDFITGLNKGHLKFILKGKKLQGAWNLFKIENDNWMIVKIKDEFSENQNNRHEKLLPFTNCTPQLATLTETLPTDNNWIFEIKYDGYRILSYVCNNKVKMVTRNNNDYTSKFKSIEKSLEKLSDKNFILDGEIVSFDNNGRSDFGLLQSNLKSKHDDYYYVVFDILGFDGEDLRDKPLIKRKEKLERLLYKSENNIIYSSHVEDGVASFNFAKQNNLEGIIAKNKNSKYLGKRTEDWLKIKCYNRQEFIIIGFTTSEKNQIFSALLLGYYENNKLRYIGKVGTGFSEDDKNKLIKELKKFITSDKPIDESIIDKNVTWLKPKLVAEIQYSELTKDKLLRQPSFIGLRKDKNPEDVILEKL